MALPTSNDSTRVMAQAVPNRLPMLPIVSAVVFPYNVVSFSVHKPPNIKLVQGLPRRDSIVCVGLQKDLDQEFPQNEKDIYPVATASRLIHQMNLPDGTIQVAFQGLSRVRIRKTLTHDGQMYADVTPAFTTGGNDDSPEMNSLIMQALEKFEALVAMDNSYSRELTNILRMNIKGPGRFADLVATYVNVPVKVKAELLNELNCRERLRRLVKHLEDEVARLAVEHEVRARTQVTIEGAQREFFLRQQLKAIRNELGEGDGAEAMVEKLRERLEEAKLPAEVHKACKAEIERLSLISEASAEFNVVHTYVDWLLSLPFNVVTKDNLDLKRARRILDRDHFGLDKVKERIIEFLAVLKLRKELKGPILCLVGPPGVGKTSLGRSVASAMGRKFTRISVGGLHDDAEIMGHRRTYVGAMPGRIIQSLKKAGSANPILMIDEVDKMGADVRGDPAAAMLEVLDPEQNHAFVDRYLDVPVDLTKVLFICTANVLDDIPPPLRDRMEVIQLSGYTLEEKEEIARRYIIPRQVEQAGLGKDKLVFRKEAVREIVRGYTREAGLRVFEQKIASICRKVATRVAQGSLKSGRVTTIDVEEVAEHLGRRLWLPDDARRKPEVGVVNGLAWTSMGGDVLLIETSRYPGEGRVNITGSLGDVMKESVAAALSYVHANAARFGIDDGAFRKYDIHIHFPEGAVPKDGPSAGVSIATALVSLFSGKPVRGDIAMSGEVSLRGKVLAVGGIKEKVLAAYRGGLREVILPKANEKDLTDIPAEARKVVNVKLTEDVEDNIRHAIVGLRPDTGPLIVPVATGGRKRPSSRRP